MATTNLAVVVGIGATLESSFAAAFAQAGATVRTLGATTKTLGAQQKALGTSIAKYSGTLAPATLAAMHRDYERLGQLMAEAKRKQDALTASLQRGRALSMQRADLRAEALGTIGVGAAVGLPIGLAVKGAADFQDQMRDIAITGRLSAQEEAAVAAAVRQNAKVFGLAHQQIGEGVQALVAGGIQNAQDLNAYTPILTKAAVATRSAVGDVATTFLAFRDNLKISAKESEAAFSMLAYAGKEGRFEVKDMARWLPALAPQLAGMGVYGKQAIAEIGAALQVARTGAGSPDEAANNLRNFLNKVMSPDTAKDFQKQGIDLQATLKAAAQRGLSPMEGMMDTITQYIQAKAPQAGEAFKAALNIGDVAQRGEALEAIEQQFKLGTLFQDQQAMGFIRAMLLQREAYQNIRQGMLAEGAALPGQTALDTDAAARMETFNSQMGRLKANLADLGVTVGAALIPALNSIVEAVTPAIAAFGRFAEAHPNVIKAGVGLVAGLLGGKLALIGLQYGANLALSAINGFGTVVALVSGKWTLLKAALEFGALSKLGGLFSTAGAAALRFFGILGAGAAALGPVGWAILAIGAAAAVVYTHWDTIGPRLKSIWQELGDDAAALGQRLKQGLDKSLGATQNLFSAPAGKKGSFIAELVGGEAAYTQLRQRLSQVGQSLSQAAGQVRAGWTAIGAATRQGALTTLQAITSFPGRALAAVRQFTGPAIAAFQAFRAQSVAAIKSWAGQAIAAFQAFRAQASAAINAAWAAIKAAFQAGLAYLRGLVGQFRAAGAAIIEGLVQGIKSKVSAAIGAIQSMGAAIKGAITGAMGIHSPSTVFASYGMNMMTGLMLGLRSMLPGVTRELQGIYRTVANVALPHLPGWAGPIGAVVTAPPASQTAPGSLPAAKVIAFPNVASPPPSGGAGPIGAVVTAPPASQTAPGGLPTAKIIPFPGPNQTAGKRPEEPLSRAALRAMPSRHYTQKASTSGRGNGAPVIYFSPTINIKSDKPDAEKTRKTVMDAMKLSMREFQRVAGRVGHYDNRTDWAREAWNE